MRSLEAIRSFGFEVAAQILRACRAASHDVLGFEIPGKNARFLTQTGEIRLEKGLSVQQRPRRRFEPAGPQRKRAE